MSATLVEWMPVILALLAAGILAGVLAGLLGVGGGIVIVPVLFLVFQSLGISPDTAIIVATSTSLLTIIPTSISSARAHHARGNIDFVLFRRWLPWMLLGVIAGSLTALRVHGGVLTGIFGAVAVAIALNSLLRPGAPPLRDSLPALPVQALLSAAIGGISVMMGIGGGTLGVTTMTAFNVATHRAVGTAALMGLVIALPGALIMLLTPETPPDAPAGTYGMANLPGFMLIVPMTMLFAPLGVKLGSRLDGQTLKKVFAVFLLVVGGRMLWQTFAA